MTATFIEAFYEPYAHALKKPGVLPQPLWSQLAPVWIREMWQVGRDWIMYPLA